MYKIGERLYIFELYIPPLNYEYSKIPKTPKYEIKKTSVLDRTLCAWHVFRGMQFR